MKKRLNCFLLCTLMLVSAGCGKKDNCPPSSTAPEATDIVDQFAGTEYDPAKFVAKKLPPVNVAREGFAIASSAPKNKNYSNLNLNDGDLSSYYLIDLNKNDSLAENTKASITVDLTKVYNLDSVKIYPPRSMFESDVLPKNFSVLVSSDGKSYTKIATGKAADLTDDGLKIDLGGVDARFVKIENRTIQLKMAVGEIEVYANVDTTENAVLNRNDIWLYKDPDTSCKLDIIRYRDGSEVDEERKLYYSSADPKVATVDENGIVRPVGYGETDVYVCDGVNQSKCRVSVRRETLGGYNVASWFLMQDYTPDHWFKLLETQANAGIQVIQQVGACDSVGNVVGPYTVFLCGQLGLECIVNDLRFTNEDAVLNLSDDRILAIVKEYEHRAGLAGIYIKDEPTEIKAFRYPRTVRVINEYNPHLIPHLNQYPTHASLWQDETLNVTGDHETFYHEMAALSAGNGRLKYLSFDHYAIQSTFGYEPQGYIMLNNVRKAGLLYNASTGYYLAHYRLFHPTGEEKTAAELDYVASVAVAYGIKSMSWFKPYDYSAVKACNDYMHSLYSVIGNSDAVEVYHTNEEPEVDLLREDFVFTHLGGGDAIYSLFESLDGRGKQHVMAVNKNYASDGDAVFTLKANDGLMGLKIYDPDSGEWSDVSIGEDGVFTVSIAAGRAVIIELPDGFDASLPKTQSDNLALNKPVYISSSTSDWTYKTHCAAVEMTDGILTNGGWVAARYDSEPYAKLDLGEIKEFGRIRITMSDDLFERRSTSFTVSVSADGVDYTEVANAKDYEWNGESAEFTFDSVSARYVRISVFTQDGGYGAIGEIEIYK